MIPAFGSVDELIDMLRDLAKHCRRHANSARSAKAIRAENLYRYCAAEIAAVADRIEGAPL